MAAAAVPTEEEHGLPCLKVAHHSGSVFQIFLHGASLTSFKNAAGEELLFLSSIAVFDGKKAIRGGIPIVFPQFGDSGPLPVHGFARNQTWTVESTGDGSATLSLEDSEATRAIWNHGFRLVYDVRATANSLMTSLRVENRDAAESAPFEFHALLHPYFRVKAIEEVRVEGLRGTFRDKLRKGDFPYPAGEDHVIREETDRVFLDNGDNAVAIVGAGASGRWRATVRGVAQDGDGAVRPTDMVEWNPWIEKSKRLDDFDDDGYHRMLCIEPGRVSALEPLAPGKQWVLTQSVEWTPLDS